MHEWSIAECIVSSIIGKLEKKQRSKMIQEIRIIVGKLQSIDLEIFKYALIELFKAKSYIIKKINIEEEDIVFRCRVCKTEFKLSELDEYKKEMIHFLPELCFSFIECPNCGSCDFQVKKGRDLKVAYIKI